MTKEIPNTPKDKEILNIQKKWPLDRERCTTITKQTKTSLFLTGNVKIIWDLEQKGDLRNLATK